MHCKNCNVCCFVLVEATKWILKNFVPCVLHFHLVVESITVLSINSAQSSVLKYVKLIVSNVVKRENLTHLGETHFQECNSWEGSTNSC